jgi:hypothetical protein
MLSRFNLRFAGGFFVRGCAGDDGSTARITTARYSNRRRSRARSSSRRRLAGVIQLVECQLPKLDVAGSSPVARSQYGNDLHAVGITDPDGVVIL